MENIIRDNSSEGKVRSDVEKSVDEKTSRKNLSPSKIDGILRSLFEFYARQQHSSGVKASFDRI